MPFRWLPSPLPRFLWSKLPLMELTSLSPWPPFLPFLYLCSVLSTPQLPLETAAETTVEASGRFCRWKTLLLSPENTAAAIIRGSGRHRYSKIFYGAAARLIWSYGCFALLFHSRS
ncbi:uncharacterized protein DS421_1g13240 [Arachis hypogaea]|nr:uncharacterized protein DS421_1g13240 [Arachis hypogaea]